MLCKATELGDKKEMGDSLSGCGNNVKVGGKA